MSEPATIERVYLQDYRPPDFLITSVNLDFELAPDTTLVRSVLSVSRNSSDIQALRLDGEDLELLAVRINGQALAQESYTLAEHSLTIHDVPDRFQLEIENRIKPCSNTKLEGLYLSGGNFCTQCEPEGFRRITYFLDRPDVLSDYTVTIRAPHQSCPVLLSNGNSISCKMLPGGMHQVTWHDPHPKPCYLFALVGGDLQHIEDHYTTTGGHKVCLRIYAVKRDLGQCRHAMDALKQSMHWDEVRYGREYDLDCFNIVAVEDFNMGAMENKGL
ncbi:MAG: aminopeptidase N, partial [Gammaproteobacteria bacterium]|nr:aminopeptidase N [Gammaproteobacteria bacterium]